MESIAERIRIVRKEAGLTLVSFGERIGITNQSLSAIENGKSNPSAQTILLICREFGVNEIWLRTGVGEPFAPKTRAETIAAYVGQVVAGKRTETETLLIELMAETSVDEWKTLSVFFKRLSEKMNKPDAE